MAPEVFAKSIAWVVLIGALGGAGGTYRYFLTPPELRFVAIDAVWFAIPLLGVALVAGAFLLLLRKPRVNDRDE